MKHFPEKIKPENIEKFKEFLKARYTCYLRRDIYELLLTRKDETEYFGLDSWSPVPSKHKFLDEIVATVTSELEGLGWKCKTSFGGTGLFIYSSEDPPVNCYEEGF